MDSFVYYVPDDGGPVMKVPNADKFWRLLEGPERIVTLAAEQDIGG